MLLPLDINVEIYKRCDKETRLKMNKIFKWNFYNMNPFFDYFHPTERPFADKHISSFAQHISSFADQHITFFRVYYRKFDEQQRRLGRPNYSRKSSKKKYIRDADHGNTQVIQVLHSSNGSMNLNSIVSRIDTSSLWYRIHA